jgi:hypothetical protein
MTRVSLLGQGVLLGESVGGVVGVGAGLDDVAAEGEPVDDGSAEAVGVRDAVLQTGGSLRQRDVAHAGNAAFAAAITSAASSAEASGI